jgi:hypothetical protein
MKLLHAFFLLAFGVVLDPENDAVVHIEWNGEA